MGSGGIQIRTSSRSSSTMAPGSPAACASTYLRTSSRSAAEAAGTRMLSRSCRCAISRSVAPPVAARCSPRPPSCPALGGLRRPTSRPPPAGSAPRAAAAATAGWRPGTPARSSRRPPRRRPASRQPVPPVRPASPGRAPARQSRPLRLAGRRHRGRRLPGPAPQLVQAGVRGDRVQPGAQRRPAGERVAIAPGPQHRLLHQVLGLVEGAQHPVAVRAQLPPVLLGLLGERGLVGDRHTRDDDARATHSSGGQDFRRVRRSDCRTALRGARHRGRRRPAPRRVLHRRGQLPGASRGSWCNPPDADDVHAALEVRRSTGVPLTARGGGTSIAGNAVGAGIVLDFSRHLNRVLEIDPDARTARIEPGVIMADLQTAAAPHGLRFGPDPSTQARATLGGMIGNNACGPHAVAYGRTSDNVARARRRRRAGAAGSPAAPGSTPVPGPGRLVRRARSASSAPSWAGSPGRSPATRSSTCCPNTAATWPRRSSAARAPSAWSPAATVRLVPISPAPGCSSCSATRHGRRRRRGAGAARAPAAGRRGHGRPARRRPSGGSAVRRRARAAPRGGLADGRGRRRRPAEAAHRAGRWSARPDALDSRWSRPGRTRPRCGGSATDGAGLAGRTPDDEPAWPGLGGRRRAARPARRLPAGVRDPAGRRTVSPGVPYGHFGDGCVHIRIDFPLEAGDDRVPRVHARRRPAGGRARRVLLRRARRRPGPQRAAAVDVLPRRDRVVRRGSRPLFDPDDLLNPGVLVRPRAAGRRPAPADRPDPAARRRFRLHRTTRGDLTPPSTAASGVGKCRADTSAAGGFMCPSYRASQDEKDVTRGRARVLQELAQRARGRSTGAIRRCTNRSTCACPARPAPPTARPGSTWPGTSRRCCTARSPGGCGPGRTTRSAGSPAGSGRSMCSRGAAGARQRAARARAGSARRPGSTPGARPGAGPANVPAALAHRARVPAPVGAIARPGRRSRSPALGPLGTVELGEPVDRPAPTVLLWVDSFTNALDPDAGDAAVAVLRAAGYRVVTPGATACCGLTWITTGQLDRRPPPG